jgi:cytoplasmic iron level regulating protein YaaA (DUF328/UPF0246 family)
MIIILSPTKNLDFSKQSITNKFTQPKFQFQAKEIMQACKSLSFNDVKLLMKLSEKLAQTNYQRIQNWQMPFDKNNAKQAILSYSGEVFNGLDANSLNKNQLLYAQDRVRILSALYGVLSPLDLIQPYRLEMLTKLSVGKSKDLYKYWGSILTDEINKELDKHKEKVLVNLASNEYSKAVNFKKIRHKLITPIFKEMKDDDFKVVTIYSKKARGLMTRFIIENKIENPEQLVLFDAEGYYYNDELSSEEEMVFVR